MAAKSTFKWLDLANNVKENVSPELHPNIDHLNQRVHSEKLDIRTSTNELIAIVGVPVFQRAVLALDGEIGERLSERARAKKAKVLERTAPDCPVCFEPISPDCGASGTETEGTRCQECLQSVCRSCTERTLAVGIRHCPMCRAAPWPPLSQLEKHAVSRLSHAFYCNLPNCAVEGCTTTKALLQSVNIIDTMVHASECALPDCAVENCAPTKELMRRMRQHVQTKACRDTKECKVGRCRVCLMYLALRDAHASAPIDSDEEDDNEEDDNEEDDNEEDDNEEDDIDGAGDGE